MKLSNATNELEFEAANYYPRVKISRKSVDLRLYLTVKRAVDICGALVGLVLCLPVFVLVSMLIKLEDRQGPVFFRQIRIGEDGIPFRMYKFRSMVANAEELLAQLMDQNEIEGHMFKVKDDPRIIRIGKIIRRTSIDEIPQLWNVLIGNMSLVGPRPPLPREVMAYNGYHRQRLQVKPGCTGLWQVSGRNSLSFEQMVDLDLKYIANRSIWLDIRIICRTFKVLLGSKDAF